MSISKTMPPEREGQLLPKECPKCHGPIGFDTENNKVCCATETCERYGEELLIGIPIAWETPEEKAEGIRWKACWSARHAAGFFGAITAEEEGNTYGDATVIDGKLVLPK